ncbi:MAG: inorganic phosphate transporter [Rhodocyclaceae bacterium]|nr:inorganic phosphate transporter [Rhodocyclaceae bacterium]
MEGLTISIWILGILIFIALAFDFMNGFHDGANSISTIVATGVLTPKQAVLFAAFFNFAALWVFQLKVAATIGKGTVDPSFVDYYVIFGALCGALIWNIVTWYYGIPSSSSHALIGWLLMVLVAWIFRHKTPGQVRRWFNYAQIFASGAYSLAHGGNDAQKTIGIIWLLLITAGVATTDVATLPNWVIYSCYLAIAWVLTIPASGLLAAAFWWLGTKVM